MVDQRRCQMKKQLRLGCDPGLRILTLWENTAFVLGCALGVFSFTIIFINVPIIGSVVITLPIKSIRHAVSITLIIVIRITSQTKL